LPRPRPAQEPALNAVKVSALQRRKQKREQYSRLRALYFRDQNPRHNKPTSPFRSVPALKGRQNVASGNARQVPDPRLDPNPERLHDSASGVRPLGSVFPWGLLNRPAAKSPPSLKVWSVGNPRAAGRWRCPRLGSASPRGDERVESPRQLLSRGACPCALPMGASRLAARLVSQTKPECVRKQRSSENVITIPDFHRFAKSRWLNI